MTSRSDISMWHPRSKGRKHPTPLKSAWISQAREIDDFVYSSRTNTESTVAYLTSAHGSGKSVTLIRYIVNTMHIPMEGKRGTWPRLVYILPREAEMTIEIDKGALHGFVTNNYTYIGDNFILDTYEGFTNQIEQASKGNSAWPEKILLVVDVELRASVAGEIFFGKLLELIMKEDGPVFSILLMSPHRSTRTVSAFETVVGEVQDIEVSDINPVLAPNLLQDEDKDLLGEHLRYLIDHTLKQDEDAGVVVATTDTSCFEGTKNLKPPAICINESNVTELAKGIRKGHRVFGMNPEVDVTACVDNLRLLIFDCAPMSILYDSKSDHLVKRKRILSENEVDLLASWALKSTTKPEEVRIYICITPNDMDSVQWNNDPAGPA
ncbi:hypothetical protein M426DRAFT_23234 [Hypoxylon sp. CI-4A]|nr:hypothetical protein M426DRAFT_23234 [Hypoxylon sp. CI-4A]